VYEFALPTNISNMLLRLLDPSGQVLSGQMHMTSEEISNATTVFNYSSLSTDPIVCPISLEPIERFEPVMKINRCGHVFKEQPLRRWLERHNHCPVCRCTL
jgi:hypothetical protein